MIPASHILEKFWGFKSFKASQEKVITTVLQGQDTLALLPTGGGKSICFQVPALVNEGICIVISPLIALMQDQVNVLKSKGVKAMALTSGMPYADLDAALDNCIYGNYKFLYLSPERLQQDIVQQRIKAMNVNLIAVDEAHCISQWGHDFRPAYREINVLRELHPTITIIALTATATPKVVEDIITHLYLFQPEVVKLSFKRDNIVFKTLEVNDKHQALLSELNTLKGSAIIYLRNRRATVDISNFLNTNGRRSTFYHGGITNEEKAKRLQDWLAGETPIMVATNAFGMGIDKPNVRKVIHFNFADSIESYYQEAGRAGRDGLAAEATIIYNEGDQVMIENMFLKNLPDIDAVKYVYSKLNSYFSIAYGEGHEETFSFNFYEFCQQYQLSTALTYQALQVLDRSSILKLSQRFAKKSEVQFLMTNKQLLYYLKENPKYGPIIKAILRSYGGVFEAPVAFNLEQIVKKAGTYSQEALLLLKELDNKDVISFEFSEHDAAVSFLVPREDKHTINPISPYIKQQKKHKEHQVNSFLEYVRNNRKCRKVQLLEYFGEDNVLPCGKCSACLDASGKKPSRFDLKSLKDAIFIQLKPDAKTSQELSEQIAQPKAKIIEVLTLLINEKRITKTADNKYRTL